MSKKMIFYGNYEHSLDDKNRVLLPSKFRDILKKDKIEKLIITAALPSERCLLTFPEDGYEDFVRSWLSDDKGPRNSETRQLERWFNSLAFPVQMDKSGRILIPQKLLTEKNIAKDIFIVGNSNKIEIWDKVAYEEEMRKIRETLTNI
jgi:MraZ protein